MMQKTPKVGFVSLGCPKALVDSEQIITQLRSEGYDIAPEYDDAELVVINTCGFVDDAIDESLREEFTKAVLQVGDQRLVVGLACLFVRVNRGKHVKIP